MAIRLRTINGTRIALCAAQTDKQEGDLYLDDADHYALSAKFHYEYRDVPNKWRICVGTFEYTPEWELMESQHLHEIRDISLLDKTNQLHSNSKLDWGVKIPSLLFDLLLIVCMILFVILEAYAFTYWSYVTLWEGTGVNLQLLYTVMLFTSIITFPYIFIAFQDSIKSFRNWWVLS